MGFLHTEVALATEAQAAFLSYSREDSDFALRLADDLKAAGTNVWLNQLEIEAAHPIRHVPLQIEAQT
jgi:hypothetical protein